MHFFGAVVAALASVAAAQFVPDGPYSTIHFWELNCVQSQYDLNIPTNGQNWIIVDYLNVTSIGSNNNSATCTAYGVDGSVTTLTGKGFALVTPPQPLSNISCIA